MVVAIWVCRPCKDCGLTIGSVSPPEGFIFDPPFTIYRLDDRNFATDFNFDLFRPFKDSEATAIYYVDSVAGNDANPGTEAQPFASLFKAVDGRSGKIIVRAKSGTYLSTSDSSGNSFRNADTLAITGLICEVWGSGRVLSVMRRTVANTWTKTVGRTNIYQTAVLSTLKSICDAGIQVPHEYDYADLSYSGTSSSDKAYDLIEDLDVVDTTEFSWYQTANVLYVHTAGGAAPVDANMRLYIGTKQLTVNAGCTLWIRDYDFHGADSGINGFSLGVPYTCYAQRVSCKYGGGTVRGNGFKFGGPGLIVLDQCLGAETLCDGFNYTAIVGAQTNAVELNSAGMSCGHYPADIAMNASTIHNGANIIRISGDYADAQNRTIHDVGDGGSWNLGCSARDSRSTGANGYNWVSGAAAGTDGTRMWLDTCVSSGSVGDLYTYGTAVIETYNLLSNGVYGGSANITTYTPEDL